MNFHQTVLLVIIAACVGMLARGVNNWLKNSPTIIASSTGVIRTNPAPSNPVAYNPDVIKVNPDTTTVNTAGPEAPIAKELTLLEKAHKFAYNGGITSFSTLEGFQPEEPLSREGAAKMFTQFAKLIDQEQYFKRVNSNVNCYFQDKSDITPTFFRDAVEACYTDIMAWDNGYFMPKLQLTHQQANIIIGRITGLDISTWSILPVSRGGLIEMMLDAYALKQAQLKS